MLHGPGHPEFEKVSNPHNIYLRRWFIEYIAFDFIGDDGKAHTIKMSPGEARIIAALLIDAATLVEDHPLEPKPI